MGIWNCVVTMNGPKQIESIKQLIINNIKTINITKRTTKTYT